MTGVSPDPTTTRGPNTTILVIGAATLFGICNVAWRFGDGSVAMMAATRSAAGLVLFTPLVVQVSRSGAFRRIVRDPTALAACLLSGLTVWTIGFLLRSIPGPAAAAAIGVLPVFVLLLGHLVGSRRTTPKALTAMCVATTAALVAAGPIAMSWGIALPVALFMGAEGASLLVAEAARRRHDSTALVMGGLILGALPAPFLITSTSVASTGLAAALAVALLGTAGRLMRGRAQGSISAAVVGSGTQVTALVTALGGVVLFADDLSATRLVALLVGATAATAAVLWSAPAERTRP